MMNFLILLWSKKSKNPIGNKYQIKHPLWAEKFANLVENYASIKDSISLKAAKSGSQVMENKIGKTSFYKLNVVSMLAEAGYISVCILLTLIFFLWRKGWIWGIRNTNFKTFFTSKNSWMCKDLDSAMSLNVLVQQLI